MIRIYLIGSLRNPDVPVVANELRAALDCEVFDDWFAAGPKADDHWKEFELERGNTFEEALRQRASRHIVGFDKDNLDRSDVVVLLMPAGKSGHLELGRSIGKNQRCVICIENDSDRWDQMYGLVYTTTEPGEVVRGVDELIEWLIENYGE